MLRNEIAEQTIKDTVEKILNRREFHQSNDQNPIAEMISQLWESIQQWVKNILGNRQIPQRQFQFNPDIFNEDVITILKLVLVVLAATLLFFLIRILVKRFYLSGRYTKPHIPQAHDYVDNPQALFDKLKMLLEQQEYTSALRFLFVAVLLNLNQRQLIHIEKWKTNRFYLREINVNANELLPQMMELSNLFNECCYGKRMVDEDEIKPWMSFYQQLLERDE